VVASGVDAGGAGPPSTSSPSLAEAADVAGAADPAASSIITELRAAALAIPDRGVYGTKTPAKDRVLAAVAAAEKLAEAGAAGPLAGSPCVCPSTGAWAPTASLPALAGPWAVLWSTVTCTGSRRVKLGLKTAVLLKGVTQSICLGGLGGGEVQGEGGSAGSGSATGTATNAVAFALLFMAGAPGALTLEAAYETLSPTRVGITLTSAALSPPALDKLFGPARLPLLLDIFNPEGWLDTTFVGGGLRVGRDDKGHVFVLERVAAAGQE